MTQKIHPVHVPVLLQEPEACRFQLKFLLRNPNFPFCKNEYISRLFEVHFKMGRQQMLELFYHFVFHYDFMLLFL